MVYHEVVDKGLERPGAAILTASEWRKSVCPSPEPDPMLVAELDPGEASVISLARAMSPCVAVIDERRGRRIAEKIYNLPVKGTIGILVEGKRCGQVADLRNTLLELKTAGYFMADSLIDAACKAGEG